MHLHAELLILHRAPVWAIRDLFLIYELYIHTVSSQVQRLQGFGLWAKTLWGQYDTWRNNSSNIAQYMVIQEIWF